MYRKQCFMLRIVKHETPRKVVFAKDHEALMRPSSVLRKEDLYKLSAFVLILFHCVIYVI